MSILIAFWLALAPPSLADVPADDSDCSVSAGTTSALMALDYLSFDQDLRDGGWRSYGNRGCYAAAASLLGQYGAAHSELSADQQRNISFHAAQMLAFAGNYPGALERLEPSFNP